MHARVDYESKLGFTRFNGIAFWMKRKLKCSEKTDLQQFS